MEVTKILKKRVLFVVDDDISLSSAPSSRFLYIARTLKKKHFKVKVTGRLGEEVVDLNTTQLGGAKHLARIKILFCTYIETLIEPYNSIMVRGILFVFPLLPLKIAGKKIIFDFHGSLSRQISRSYQKTLYNRLKSALYHLLEGIALKHSDVLICCSRGIMDLLGDDEKRKSILLENGLDIGESKNAIQDAKREKREICKKYSIQDPFAVFLGNWGRAGSYDMEIMFQGATMAGVTLVVIGEGENLNEFKEKWDSIKFVGKLSKYEALKICSLSSAALVPYRRIPLPVSQYSSRKVKDYLSLGKPIIMAAIEGREPYLIRERNVLLYEPESAEDLARKITKLLSDDRLRKMMKTNNIKLAQRFDWKTLVEQSGIIELLK